MSDVYTVPVIATFDDEDGVLANDIDQNNGTLIANDRASMNAAREFLHNG